MGSGPAKRFYAWVAQGSSGVESSWADCEALVRGRPGARYKGFATRAQADAWLDAGGQYEDRAARKAERQADLPQDAIFFDAGTGRGDGTEANVTDRDGVPLAHLAAPENVLTPFGTIRLSRGRTNNYGELMACLYGLKIARQLGRKVLMGDSALVLDYWSKGIVSATKREEDPDLARLAALTARERRVFEAEGGVLRHVPGGINPADLGFHRD